MARVGLLFVFLKSGKVFPFFDFLRSEPLLIVEGALLKGIPLVFFVLAFKDEVVGVSGKW